MKVRRKYSMQEVEEKLFKTSSIQYLINDIWTKISGGKREWNKKWSVKCLWALPANQHKWMNHEICSPVRLSNNRRKLGTTPKLPVPSVSRNSYRANAADIATWSLTSKICQICQICQIFNRAFLGCIDASDSESRLILQHFSRSTRFTHFFAPLQTQNFSKT